MAARFRPVHICLFQRLGGFGQTFGDRRRTLQIPLARLIAIVVELACECIERLVDLRLIRQRQPVAVRHHRHSGILLRLLDVHIARLVILGFRAVAFMLIDELHVAGVVVNRDLVRIVLLQDALVRLQARDVTVHGVALAPGFSSLVLGRRSIVASADLLMLPRRAIGEQHGDRTGDVAVRLLRRFVHAPDIGRYKSLEEGFLIVQSQDDVSVALRADVTRDLHRTRLRCRNHMTLIVQLRVDEYRAVVIGCDRRHVASLDGAAADGDSRAVRLDGTPHLRVDVHKSLDIDLCAAHILACLDRAEVLARILHTDFDSIFRLVVIFNHELRMSVTAIVSRTARIAHDKDATPVKAALRIGLDIHALDIFDRERAAVDGDGIRRALPTGLRTLVREKTMSTGTCLDIETMSRHINRAFDVAVPIDRTELIVLHRDDRLVRRLYFELDVMMERIVAVAIVDALFLPEFLHGFHIVVISFSNLLLDRAGCRRRCRIRFYMGASIGFSIVEIQLLRDSRAGQPLSDHRCAFEIALALGVAVVVELSGKRIERLAHGIFIAQFDTVAVRHHRDRGVLRSMLDMRIVVALTGIYIRRIAAIVLRPRSVIDMLIVESCTAGEVVKRERLVVVAVNAGIHTMETLIVAILKNIFRISLTGRAESDIRHLLGNRRCDKAFGDHRRALEIGRMRCHPRVIELAGEGIEYAADLRLIVQLDTVAVRYHRDLGALLCRRDLNVARLVVRRPRTVVFMLVHHLHLAAEIVDEDVALVLLANNAAVSIETVDAAVAQLRLAVLIHACANLDMLPCSAVLEDEIPLAGRPFPLMERPSVHISGEKSLEKGVLRRQTEIGAGGAVLHPDIALDLHVAALVHRNDVAFTVRLCIDLCRADRINIERRLALRDDPAAADRKLSSIDDDALRRLDINLAFDVKICSAGGAFQIDSLVLGSYRNSRICSRSIMNEKLCIPLICITQQMDAVVLRLDRRLAERLQLKRAAAHKNACGLVAAQLAGLRAEVATANVNIQRMTLHLNAATPAFAPQDAAEIIPICVIQCLDGIVGTLHSKCDILI